MGWWEALKAAVISIPKFLDELKELRLAFERAAAAAENRRLEEVRNEQNKLQLEVQRVVHDEERARLLRRVAELERKL